jgi:hypothetical protein
MNELEQGCALRLSDELGTYWIAYREADGYHLVLATDADEILEHHISPNLQECAGWMTKLAPLPQWQSDGNC